MVRKCNRRIDFPEEMRLALEGGNGQLALIFRSKQRRVEQKGRGQQTRLRHGRRVRGHCHLKRVRAHEFGAESGPHLGDLTHVRQLGVPARVNVD